MEIDAKTIGSVLTALAVGLGSGGLGGYSSQAEQLTEQREHCETLMADVQESYRHSLELIVESIAR